MKHSKDVFHIQRNFFLPLAFDYCTLARVIQVNKVVIILLTVGTQGLPTPPARVSKTRRYKSIDDRIFN